MIYFEDSITAALSGGADSVCLLLVLNELSAEMGFSLKACHVNHMIRGDESDRDEMFCRKLCERLDIPITVYKCDIPAYAKKSGLSLELAARDIRYRKLYECAGNGKIATAHTLSDNAETVIHNLIRGTGLKGLCGIPPVRDNIIRPLIGITREQVEQFLEIRDQDYVTDSTNLSDDYTRNRIRHKIIPEILNINKGFYKCFENEQEILYRENRLIEQLSEKAYREGYNDGALFLTEDIPIALRKRAVGKFLSANKLPVSSFNINEAEKLLWKDGRFNISKDIYVTGRRGRIFIEKISCEKVILQKPLYIGKNSIFEDIVLNVRKVNAKDINSFDNSRMIDLEKIKGTAFIRSRKNGDKIKLWGREHSSSVKKLLNEKIPPQKRQHIHFICDDEGLIFMEGMGTAKRCICDKNTKICLVIDTQTEE